jgi:hypothetical protein
MAKTNQSFIEEVLHQLMEDEATAGVRWKVYELVRYMNAGLLWIAEARPDAMSTYNHNFALSVGTRQTLPAGGYKLFEVLGNAAGGAVRLVDRKMLDAVLPAWRSGAGSTTIKNYVYDEREPETFEVYPPAAIGAALRIRFAQHATPITVPSPSAVPSDVSGNVPLDDQNITALREYVLFRCKAKDADFAPGVVDAAQTHLSLAVQSLGVELAATGSTSPRSTDAAAGRGVTTGA